MMLALTQGVAFTGDDVLGDHAVIIANGLIERVYPEAQLAAGIEIHDLSSALLVPDYSMCN